MSGYVATTLPHFVAFVDQPTEVGAVLEEVRLGGKIHNGDCQALLIAWDEHVYFTAYL